MNKSICMTCMGLDDDMPDCENCNGTGFEPEKEKEFYNFIGKTGGVPRKGIVGNFQKETYCYSCLTTHTANNHLKGVKNNEDIR